MPGWRRKGEPRGFTLFPILQQGITQHLFTNAHNKLVLHDDDAVHDDAESCKKLLSQVYPEQTTSWNSIMKTFYEHSKGEVFCCHSVYLLCFMAEYPLLFPNPGLAMLLWLSCFLAKRGNWIVSRPWNWDITSSKHTSSRYSCGTYACSRLPLLGIKRCSLSVYLWV